MSNEVGKPVKPVPNMHNIMAIGHLTVLFQIAIGEHKGGKEAAEDRFKAVLAYLRTGECRNDEQIEQIVQKLLREIDG